jgi:hypothetical protein
MRLLRSRDRSVPRSQPRTKIGYGESAELAMTAVLKRQAEQFAQFLDGNSGVDSWPHTFSCKCGTSWPYFQGSSYERCESCGERWHRFEGAAEWLTASEVDKTWREYRKQIEAVNKAFAPKLGKGADHAP